MFLIHRLESARCLVLVKVARPRGRIETKQRSELATAEAADVSWYLGKSIIISSISDGCEKSV